MPITHTVTLDVEVTDETALRQAVRLRMVEDGISEAAADAYLDPERSSVEECLCLMIDPGLSVPGVEVDDSAAEAVTVL